MNISEADECERLVQEARSLYGPVDVLVNNAALSYFLPVTDYAVNRWMRSWAVNVPRPVHPEPPRAGGYGRRAGAAASSTSRRSRRSVRGTGRTRGRGRGGVPG